MIFMDDNNYREGDLEASCKESQKDEMDLLF